MSVVEKSFQCIQKIGKKTSLTAISKKPKSEIFNEWNFVRNTIKHHGKIDDEIVVINLFDEAYWMIKRGLFNADKLEINIRNQLDFENWIIININM